MGLGSRGFKVAVHVCIDRFHFGVYGGIYGELRFVILELICLISFLFLEISNDRALKWFSSSYLWVWAIVKGSSRNGIGGSTQKGVIDEGYHYDQCKRGIQWNKW
jgi:hypothetical protein